MQKEQASFRDPCGFLFRKDGCLYRQINNAGAEDYEMMMNCGLYADLVNKKWMIPHTEDCNIESIDGKAYKILHPEIIPFISYPYEWCFEQYRDAALLTLDIALHSLNQGMILKDASAYNIQFIGCRPVFIDTLSFVKYKEGQVWDAYGQFCRHFLSPLLLISGVSPACAKISSLYIDGIPLDFATKILRGRWKRKPSIYLHLYLHSKQVEGASSDKKIKIRKISLFSLKAIINNLRKIIMGLSLPQRNTEWASYYNSMLNYSDMAFKEKGRLAEQFLNECGAKFVCDLGANRGEFSKNAAKLPDSYVVSYDVDYSAVSEHYKHVKTNNNENILPLVIDLTNPSPAIGWANEERYSLQERANFDCIMALALIHHLVISNNVPLERVAEFFSRIGNYLIIEFVPKTDSQVKKLLLNREDIFQNYSEPSFESAFACYFKLVRKEIILGSERTLYLYKTSNNR
jgi:hypothetical protein